MENLVLENTFTETEVYKLFEKLVVRNVFKIDRDYEVAKKTLYELTGIDYEERVGL